VLAVRRRGTESFDWSLAASYRIAPQDRLLVLATRAGLGMTLARNRPLVPPSGGTTPLDPPLPAAVLGPASAIDVQMNIPALRGKP
jgi:hypothetical protein